MGICKGFIMYALTDSVHGEQAWGREVGTKNIKDCGAFEKDPHQAWQLQKPTPISAPRPAL